MHRRRSATIAYALLLNYDHEISQLDDFDFQSNMNSRAFCPTWHICGLEKGIGASQTAADEWKHSAEIADGR